MIAFPGAEGAGAFAAGGRGGDVYYVTNLNDAGPGSLRNGIASANGPRTILFAVGGTINLQTDLRINKPFLTIAGQTAPGGGITLAGRQTRIVDTNDVIVQHIRFRPGDRFTTADAGYEPDALWVQNSQNIMIDHVTASWATDENLSVTHGSQNVTVQWSLITEALHDAGHHKGNHGFGSLINGGDITFHHNLYAHNRSRNPRPQQGTPGLRLDFVNNIIHNPGDRYAYSGSDNMDVNFVGNYGIDGPSSQPPPALYVAGSTQTRIYYDGNWRDGNRNGILDGFNVGNAAVQGPHTRLDARVDLPQITTTNAEQAYIQVLSRAGAAAFRDAVDQRVIRSVINQAGRHIDSQDEVGGWPDLPAGAGPAYADGIPDWWKAAHGLDPNDATLGGQDSGNGYTWLERYLHSLSAPYFPPAEAQRIEISTAFGRGADAQVSENAGVAGGSGIDPDLNARYAGPAGQNNEYILLRFDLAQLAPGTVTGASLELTAFRDMADRTLRVYGLDHDVEAQMWDEQAVRFDNAPALEFDGDSGTRGLIAEDVLLLGQFNTAGAAEGDVISFSNPNLAVFLNLLAYRYEGEEGVVTLLIEQVTETTGQSRFASKEATHLLSGTPGDVEAGTYAPRLVIDGVYLPIQSFLPGDANGDGRVDGEDFLIWQAGFGTQAGASWDQGDFNGDGRVDGEDFLIWQANFGRVSESSAATPEPVLLAPLGIGVGLLLRRPTR